MGVCDHSQVCESRLKQAALSFGAKPFFSSDQNNVFLVKQGLFSSRVRTVAVRTCRGCCFSLFVTHLLQHFQTDEEKLKKKKQSDRQRTGELADVVGPKDSIAASSIETVPSEILYLSQGKICSPL